MLTNESTDPMTGRVSPIDIERVDRDKMKKKQCFFPSKFLPTKLRSRVFVRDTLGCPGFGTSTVLDTGIVQKVNVGFVWS